jgi:hypothetical protein
MRGTPPRGAPANCQQYVIDSKCEKLQSDCKSLHLLSRVLWKSLLVNLSAPSRDLGGKRLQLSLVIGLLDAIDP